MMNNIQQLVPQVDMHQLVRIIQQGRFKSQKLNFRAANSLAFPSSDVTAYEQDHIELSCLALQGVSSPLPHYFVTDAMDEDNASLRSFLDMLNQSIYRAYFKAWSNKYPYLFQKTGFRGHQILASLGSENIPFHRVHPGVLPLFLYEQRNYHGLKSLLNVLCPNIDVHINIRQSEWIDTHLTMRLGVDSMRLSDNITLGKRLLSYAHRLEITIGPVPYNTVRTLEISEWISRYLNHAIKFDLQWVIKPCDGISTLGRGMALGWVSTLGKRTLHMKKVQHEH